MVKVKSQLELTQFHYFAIFFALDRFSSSLALEQAESSSDNRLHEFPATKPIQSIISDPIKKKNQKKRYLAEIAVAKLIFISLVWFFEYRL